MHFTSSVLPLAAALAFATYVDAGGNHQAIDRRLLHHKRASSPIHHIARDAQASGDCPKRLRRNFGVKGPAESGRKALDWSPESDDGRTALERPTNSKKVTNPKATTTINVQDAAPTLDWPTFSPDSGNYDEPSSSSWSSPSSSSSSSSSSAEEPQNTAPISSEGDLGGAGLFSFVSSSCGASGATEDVTKTTGPNGSMDFLNCGLYTESGWSPPNVHIDMVRAVSLDEAILEDGSPFAPCKPYVYLFDKYGAETGLPPILLASIAMQESSCNADAMGDNGGAYGLMQITEDKCTSGVSCSDPDYNIKTGAYYFKSRLDANDGNILLAMGEYNGWYKDLTVAKATAIKDSCCQCQNNLNYHQQMLNGWFQGMDGSQLGDWVMGC